MADGEEIECVDDTSTALVDNVIATCASRILDARYYHYIYELPYSYRYQAHLLSLHECVRIEQL